MLRCALLASILFMTLGHADLTHAAGVPPRIPVEHFFDNPKISSAQLSPDGTRLAFLAPHKGRMNIWVCTIADGVEKARVITEETKRGIPSFFWSRNGKYVLYSQDTGGNENYRLYRVDPSATAPKGGVPPATCLTPFEGTRTGVVDIPRDRPDELLISLNQRDKKYFDVHRLKISTAALELVEQNPGDVDSWTTDTHGVVRACAAQIAGGRTEIRVRDSGSGPFRTLAVYNDEENATVYGFTPDGNFLLMGSARNANTTGFVQLSTIETKQCLRRGIRLDRVVFPPGTETLVTRDPEYDLDTLLISDKTNEVLAAAFDKDRVEYQVFDPQLKKDLALLEKIHDGDVMIRSTDRDETKFIVAYNSPTDPGATYLYDRATGEAKFLYRPRPWLVPEQLTGMQPVSFPARDGIRLHGYLTLPNGVPGKNLPLVLNVHGGPWARDSWGYDPECQFLANRGYAVLQVNFRGSTGYGKNFVEAGNREWGGKMLDDLIDAVEWAVKQGIADRARLGIYGGSYGGYATLAALAFRPDVFACGIDYVGVSNLLTFMQTIPPYWETFREVMHRRVGNPEKDKEFLRSRSPVFAADKIRVPLLIAQGYNDPRVNHAESEQIVEALKKNGHPVEYLVKMDEGHGFANPENRLDFYRKMEAFLAQHLPPDGPYRK